MDVDSYSLRRFRAASSWLFKTMIKIFLNGLTMWYDKRHAGRNWYDVKVGRFAGPSEIVTSPGSGEHLSGIEPDAGLQQSCKKISE